MRQTWSDPKFTAEPELDPTKALQKRQCLADLGRRKVPTDLKLHLSAIDHRLKVFTVRLPGPPVLRGPKQPHEG